MTAQKDQPKAASKREYDALIKAIAKANGHPDPDAFSDQVHKHLEAK